MILERRSLPITDSVINVSMKIGGSNKHMARENSSIVGSDQPFIHGPIPVDSV